MSAVSKLQHTAAVSQVSGQHACDLGPRVKYQFFNKNWLRPVIEEATGKAGAYKLGLESAVSGHVYIICFRSRRGTSHKHPGSRSYPHSLKMFPSTNMTRAYSDNKNNRDPRKAETGKPRSGYLVWYSREIPRPGSPSQIQIIGIPERTTRQ